MTTLQERLRKVCAEIRRTPIRLDTWIPLIQESADALDVKAARIALLEEMLREIITADRHIEFGRYWVSMYHDQFERIDAALSRENKP